MKAGVAITLIIMGGLLVMTPAASDSLFQKHVVEMLSRPGITSVSLEGKMGDLYRFGCWLTGTAMIGIAVWRSASGRATHVAATVS